MRDFYMILDWYKTGAWKERIAGLYQSKLCRNLRRRAGRRVMRDFYVILNQLVKAVPTFKDGVDNLFLCS